MLFEMMRNVKQNQSLIVRMSAIEGLQLVLERNQRLVRDILDKNVLIDDGLWDLQHYLNTFTAGRCNIIIVMFIMYLSSRSISSSGRRCPDVSAKLMPVLRRSAGCCHRTKRICDVFPPSLSWLSSASFSGYHSLHYCLL